jgi:hypothetical protein
MLSLDPRLAPGVNFLYLGSRANKQVFVCWWQRPVNPETKGHTALFENANASSLSVKTPRSSLWGFSFNRISLSICLWNQRTHFEFLY